MSYSWDLNDDGVFGDATGSTPTFSSVGYTAGNQVHISLRVTDAGSNVIQASSTVTTEPPVIYVDATAIGSDDGSSWTDAFTTLTEAIQNTVPGLGQTIKVAGSTYYPTMGTDRSATFQLKTGVTIYGGYAGDQYARLGAPNPDDRSVDLYPTILSGDIGISADNSDNSYHVVTGSGTDTTAFLVGVTITAGNSEGSPLARDFGSGILDFSGSPTLITCTISDNIGVGVYNNNNSSPSLSHCTISGNADAGMYNNKNSSPTLTYCTIRDNNSAGGMQNVSSAPTLTNCTFSGNSASYNGGGMYNYDSSPTLTNCTFSSNLAGYDGGGMYNTGSSPTLIDCTFTENSANASFGGGGGLYNSVSSPILNNCDFSGNSAADDGGGIYNNISSATSINCTFRENSAADDGGGMYNYGSSSNLTNCTFNGNSASEDGGGIDNAVSGSYDSSVTLTNCMLWGDLSPNGNEMYIGSESFATVSYSDVQGGFSGTGNIDADPQFIRNPSPGIDGVWGTADDDYGDLHLQFTSPCIDAGSNAAVPTGVTTDLDGNPRIFDFPGAHDPGAIVDMGAYEVGLNLDQVIVPAGQTVALPSGGYDFTANKLTIGAEGTLDVGDDSLGVTYSAGNSQASQIAGWIASGYSAGQWNGTGIVSTNTLGQPANLTGVGYYDDGTQIKIRRSWYGDTNLDGQINADDYALVLLGQQTHQTNWQSGNFNYDTKVNGDDWMTFILGASYSSSQTLPFAAIPTARSNSLIDLSKPLL